MGNRPVYNPQSIPPPISQPVGPNLIYTINSQPTHAAQIPQVSQLTNTARVPQVPRTISQLYSTPPPHINTQSEMWLNSQSVPAPQDHSVHNIPDGTTLQMLTH